MAAASVLMWTGLRCAAIVVVCALAGCATRVERPPADRDATTPALVFRHKSLAPTDGGRLVEAIRLEPGDILLSASSGIAPAGIRLLTDVPVSRVAVYVGSGEVAEARRGGVRLRPIDAMLAGESVVAVFRHPALDADGAARIGRLARSSVGQDHADVGVLMRAPFALQRRLCGLPGMPPVLRESCLSTLATIELIHGGDDRFFCSRLVLEAYRSVGLPITRARPHWVSADDVLQRAGDMPALPVEQPLMYVGHLKFAPSALPTASEATPEPAAQMPTAR